MVVFRVWTRVRWTERSRIVVDPSDQRGVEREANRFVQNHHVQLRDARMRSLMPSQCLQSARHDGSHSVFMIYPDDKIVTEAMTKAAAYLHHDDNMRLHGPPRQASVSRRLPGRDRLAGGASVAC